MSRKKTKINLHLTDRLEKQHFRDRLDTLLPIRNEFKPIN